MFLVKYGVSREGDKGFSMEKIDLSDAEHWELLDSINALIRAKLKRMDKTKYNETVMIESFVYF